MKNNIKFTKKELIEIFKMCYKMNHLNSENKNIIKIRNKLERYFAKQGDK